MTNVQQGGRVALITGASRGIGACVARLLASRGRRVVVNYRSSRNEADDVVASITSAGGQAMAVQADVRDGSAVLGMVEQIRAAMGEVEVLVHNALIPYAIKSFDEISWDELGGKLDQEMRAAFLVTKAVVPGMTTRGYGRIVYLDAVLSRRPQDFSITPPDNVDREKTVVPPADHADIIVIEGNLPPSHMVKHGSVDRKSRYRRQSSNCCPDRPGRRCQFPVLAAV
jgi:NAD(P)-dependent dehydrogenase (short-subunit alcohol dehydrogenase family)